MPAGETEKYDVFLCFKNLLPSGQRTKDSILGESVYQFLVSKGLKVFYSNISLEQLGVSAYQKAIDDSLDMSKTLVAVGTCFEHLDSNWVRYEWGSFLNDTLTGKKPRGRLFSYIADMNPANLPRGLRQQQAVIHGPRGMETLYSFLANALKRKESADELTNGSSGDAFGESDNPEAPNEVPKQELRPPIFGRLFPRVLQVAPLLALMILEIMVIVIVSANGGWRWGRKVFFESPEISGLPFFEGAFGYPWSRILLISIPMLISPWGEKRISTLVGTQGRRLRKSLGYRFLVANILSVASIALLGWILHLLDKHTPWW